MPTSELAGKRVVVFGMARSGVDAARLAVACGAEDVLCTDLREDAPRIDGCRQAYGFHDEADLARADLIILSPGIPPNIGILQRARAHGTVVMGELGVAARELASRQVPMLAVTGTNGKSSTVWLLHQLLQQAGRDSWVGGNLGTPLSALAVDLVEGRPPPDAAVVEVSSYQLETCGSFRPRAAAVLNLQPDHLARHKSMAGYAAAKLAIFASQGAGDLAVIKPSELITWAAVPAEVTRLELGARPGVQLDATPTRSLRFDGTPDDGHMDLSAYPLPGPHNAENLGAAMLLAMHVGVRRADCDLRQLRSLPHRLERVLTTVDDIRWVNDSKATNVDAALVGISAFDGPLLALLGGQGKAGSDYQLLVHALQIRARRVICFGQAGPAIARHLTDAGMSPELVDTLPAAVTRARALALPGDTILLSPACASFDAYSDFEARGRHFADLAALVNQATRRPDEQAPSRPSPSPASESP